MCRDAVCNVILFNFKMEHVEMCRDAACNVILFSFKLEHAALEWGGGGGGTFHCLFCSSRDNT